MSSLFKAAAGFCLAPALLGTGPFAGPADPHWELVKADLAAARPQARLQESLAGQARTLFRTGTPRPDVDR
jgi:hypothetical protein